MSATGRVGSLDRFNLTRDAQAAGLALLFAIGVLAVPFERLRGPFADYEVYLATFQWQPSVRDLYDPHGLIEYFRNEIAWDEFVRLLAAGVGGPQMALTLISAFILTVNAFVLFRRFGYMLPAVLLVNPVFLDLALSQLRLGFAIALLLVALETRSRWCQAGLVIVTAFMHSSIPIFVGIFVAARLVQANAARWRLLTIFAFAALILVVLVGVLAFGRDAVLESMDDRRAHLYDSISGSSKLFLVLWGPYFLAQAMAGKQYLAKADNFYAFIIVGVFVAMTLVGTYGSRFLAGAYCVVVASALNFDERNRNVVIPAVLLFQLVSTIYWFGLN